MKEFFLQYYKLIFSGLFFIISVIVFILRKRPNKVIDSVKEVLFKYCLIGICETEALCTDKGIKKLEFALRYIKELFARDFPELDFSLYEETCRRYIEAILCTPEKHENERQAN